MIIITGASGGIGRFLFDSLAKGSGEIIGTYYRSRPEAIPGNFVKLNLCDYKEVEHFVETRIDKLKEIVLINCAAITYTAFAHKSEPARWKEVVDTNLTGTYYLIRALLPLMREQKYGRIINFASVVAEKPTPGVSAYAASKAALWGLAKTVAIENATYNITINTINLGYAETGMINSVPEEFRKSILAQIPAGRLCSGTDILNTVTYIMNTGYLTGATIDLSGGLV